MAAEIKKEIELEIASVLFMGASCVTPSCRSIQQAERLVERLNEIVRGTDEIRSIARIYGGAGCSQIPTGRRHHAGFYHSPEAAELIDARWRNKPHCAQRNIPELQRAEWAYTVDQSAESSTQAAKSEGRRLARRQYSRSGHGLRARRTHFAVEARAEDLEEYPHWQPAPA